MVGDGFEVHPDAVGERRVVSHRLRHLDLLGGKRRVTVSRLSVRRQCENGPPRTAYHHVRGHFRPRDAGHRRRPATTTQSGRVRGRSGRARRLGSPAMTARVARRSRSPAAAGAPVWSSGARRWPRPSGPPTGTRSTGGARSPASVIPSARLRGGRIWRRPPTGPTAPGGCSPATDRGLALPGPASGRVRIDSHLGTPRRRPGAERCLRDRPGPLCPACQQAHRRPSATTAGTGSSANSTSSTEMRVIVALGGFAFDHVLRVLGGCGVSRCPAPARVRPRRRGADLGPTRDRLLSPEPAEHVHRPPHRGDVRRRVRGRPATALTHEIRFGYGVSVRIECRSEVIECFR